MVAAAPLYAGLVTDEEVLEALEFFHYRRRSGDDSKMDSIILRHFYHSSRTRYCEHHMELLRKRIAERKARRS